MADEIVKPFLVKYDGRDASRNVLDGQALGESIYGSARFYNAVAHYCMWGSVPRGRYKRDFSAYAQPARPGSWDQLWFIAPVIAGEYGIHARLYNEAISYIFAKVVDGVKNVWTRPSETTAVVTQLVNALQEQARLNADVQGQLAGGLVRANDNLASLQAQMIDTIPVLARETRPHGVHIVKPVGTSCSVFAQFSGTPLESVITEPEAEVIRGDGDFEVDPMTTFKVNRIREINLNTGHCLIDVEGIGAIAGRITDPVLDVPDNIYTRSMSAQSPLVVQAKAVRRGGSVERLYISNAE